MRPPLRDLIHRLNFRQQAWLKRCRNTAGNYSRVWEPTNWPQRGTKPGPPGCSGFAQAPLRFAHPQLRLKQQLLRSKDGNGNCSCRDSDVEFPVTQAFAVVGELKACECWAPYFPYHSCRHRPLVKHTNLNKVHRLCSTSTIWRFQPSADSVYAL
jgi:hypothetical protein